MSHSRRQSFNRPSSRSGYSPITPRSSREFEHSSPAQHFEGAREDSGGLGNLADELGEWGSEEEEMASEFEEELEQPHENVTSIGTAVEHDGSTGVQNMVNLNGVRDSGVAMQSSPSTQSRATLSPSAAIRTKKHNRQRSLYDGSDYGEDSDLENEGISPALEARMAAVESLARRGMEENGSASDEVVKRVTEQLRDLGSQIAIENGATRYSTPLLIIRNFPANTTQSQNCPRFAHNPPHPPIARTHLFDRFVYWTPRHSPFSRRHRRTPPPR